MTRLDRSRYVIREAESVSDVVAAQRLRFRAFRAGAGRRQATVGAEDALDRDRFDAVCRHILIEHRDSAALVATLRILILPEGHRIDESYSAQFYDLARLKAYPGAIMELGRLCVDPRVSDPDVLRLALAALGRFVESLSIRLIVGCSSFAGTDPAPYGAAFWLLRARHLAPPQWHPGEKAPHVIRFAEGCSEERPDLKQARAALPPLLRSYLSMGGWVSDHAVVDDDLNTLHVFTAVEVPEIPTGRARILRALAR